MFEFLLDILTIKILVMNKIFIQFFLLYCKKSIFLNYFIDSKFKINILINLTI